MDQDAADSKPGRARNGRFAAGNRASRGNPHAKRVAALRSALLEAVEPRMFGAIAKRLLRNALEGDVAAAKVLFDRTIGRGGTPSAFRMPELRTAADLPPAMNRILQAAARGEITTEDAARLAELVDTTGRALAAADMEERLARLEGAVGVGRNE